MRLLAGISTVLLLLALPGDPGSAQVPGSDNTSRTVLQFAITIDGAEEVRTRAIDGSMTTVQIDGRGTFGFIPKATVHGTVRVEVYSVTESMLGFSDRPLETLELSLNEPAKISADPGIAVSITEVVVEQPVSCSC